MTATRRGMLILLFAGLTALVAVASTSSIPDAEINPVSGKIETVDATPVAGVEQVRHTIDSGHGRPESTQLLTDSATPNHQPRLAISSLGETFVVWWREGTIPQVLYRRGLLSGTWEEEAPIGRAGEPAINPEIVWDGQSMWVSYEIDLSGGGTGSILIAATGGGDSADPFPDRTIIGSTHFTGGRDTSIETDAGQVWVTWIDSATAIGWSRYDRATMSWTPVAYEPYSGPDDIAPARQRIHDQVLAAASGSQSP